MTTVTIDGVSKWYGDVSALSDISLDIEPGILGLLGPNGAGKTTLLKLMGGQLRPSLGSIEVLGQEFQNNPKLFSHIGFCPESDTLWEEFDGASFLSAMLRLQGWTKHDADKRTRELMGMLDLEKAGKRKVGGYSKGMRQKLRLAQSLAHEPDLLFLDEPMSGLDATSRMLIADVIRDAGDRGVTIVVSSHILYEVETLTKDMALIHQGQLRARGNVYEIRELLTDHPLQLELSVDQPRKLSSILIQYDHVVRVALEDERDPSKITVYTKRQNRFFEDLPRILKDADVRIQSLHAEDEDMESVFKYLVHERSP